MSAAADPAAELAKAHAVRVCRGKRSASARRPLPQGSDLPSVFESRDMEPHDDDDAVQHPQAGRSGGQEEAEEEEGKRPEDLGDGTGEWSGWQKPPDWKKSSGWHGWTDYSWRGWSDGGWPRDSGSGAASGERQPECFGWRAQQEAEREEERARGATGPGPLEQLRGDRGPPCRQFSPVHDVGLRPQAAVAARPSSSPPGRSGGPPAGPQPPAPPTRRPLQLFLWECAPPPEMAERSRERSPAAEVGQESAAVAAPLN